ncbi:restriction endonuclease subunit S [Bacteroides finegoldii]|jgi:type I restriction enzyme ecoAI specificity protein (fragment)|uniref:restriction endonuclease subunit S n=1 Tax=Bacteroides finegoldii TaxID=338188 RepID=UPI00189DE3A7|nr:restriction endonuclease subunit S [Bacteroides finegoldii]
MDTKKLRQKILDLAIRGKLVPQDPNDEPASVLLERIKEEKERLIKEGKIKRSKKTVSSDTPHYENVPFEVPEGWQSVPVSELFCLNPKSEITDATSVGFIPMACVNDGFSGNHQFEERIWKEVKKGYCHFQNGDIGIAKISPCFENLKSTIFQNLPNNYGAGTTELVILRPLNIHAKFYLYLFKSQWYISEGTKYFKGVVGQQRVHKGIFTDLQIPLPPLVEQYRIVAEIEKWFALIDQIEQGKTGLQTIVMQTKSKILDLAIHGKLVPQDPNDEPAFELLKRINPDFTPCDNGHYTQLPDGWAVAPMQMLCSLIDGEKQNGIERINLDVKYLRGERDAKTLTSGKYVAANSLLILVDGENSGEVFRTPIDGYQGSTFKLLSINYDMNTEYVLQVINLHRTILRENKVGSAIPHLNKKLFKAIEVPIPPYKEQQRIVEAANKVFMSLDVIMGSL